MFRTVIRLTAITSGSYVFYRVCDHPVVKADALTLIHGTQEGDGSPAENSTMPMFHQLFERWLSAFYSENKTIPGNLKRTRQGLGVENEAFQENHDEQAFPFGSYADSSESRLLRFAIPLHKKYLPMNGIFTVNANRSSVPQSRRPNIFKVFRFFTALLAIFNKIVSLLVPDQSTTFEDKTVSLREEFFPVTGGDPHSFDIHSWTTDIHENLHRNHKENNPFFFRLCQKLYSHFPSDNEILLIVDPLGAAGALQLVEYLNASKKSPQAHGCNRDSPRVRVLYVRPSYWKTNTSVDQRLHKAIREYQRSCDDVRKAGLLCITSDYHRAIQNALKENDDSGIVIALLTDEVMKSFKKSKIVPRRSSNGLHVLRINLE